MGAKAEREEGTWGLTDPSKGTAPRDLTSTRAHLLKVPPPPNSTIGW
jgi:hypothetical protein